MGKKRFSFTYDASGNTLSKTDAKLGLTKKMVYDHANRITSVTDGAGRVMGTYQYDDQGVRVRKIVNRDTSGTKTRFVISTHNKYFITGMPQTADGVDLPSLASATNNIYLNGVRIASVDSAGNGAYYLANHVDSVKAVTDDSGDVVSRSEYLPYGETFVESGTKVIAPKYNGQALDEESNLYYYNARHYDPEIARFVTADSVTDGPSTIKGWNRYMYVGGNPIMYKDPTGHEGKSEGGFFGAMGDVMSAIFGGSESSDTSKKKIQPSEVVNEKRKPEDITIYLDVGHGGRVDGGGSLPGQPEKDLNLENAVALSSYLKAKGYNVILSRHNDVYSYIETREDRPNELGVDYMFAIHVDNHNSDSRLGVYHSANEQQGSQELGISMVKSLRGNPNMPEGMRVTNKLPKVFKQTDNANMPALIIEIGNVGSEQDSKLLRNMSRKRRLLIRSIGEAIDDAIQKRENIMNEGQNK